MAIATVKPRDVSSREKTSLSAFVAPEMTAVSKPNSNAPSEATRAHLIIRAFSLYGLAILAGLVVSVASVIIG
jgi:hypothetical protein